MEKITICCFTSSNITEFLCYKMSLEKMGLSDVTHITLLCQHLGEILSPISAFYCYSIVNWDVLERSQDIIQ